MYIYTHTQSSLDSKASMFFSKFMFDDFLRKEGTRVGEWGLGWEQILHFSEFNHPFHFIFDFYKGLTQRRPAF